MRSLVTCLVFCLPIVLVCGAGAETAPTNLVVNPSFEIGKDAPAGWAAFAIGGSDWEREGADGSRSVSLTGLGDDVAWWSPTVKPELEPNHLYRLSYWLRRDAQAAGGKEMAGFDWLSREAAAGLEWGEQAFCFRTPDMVMTRTAFRLGEDHVKGKVYFDSVALMPAVPVYSGPAGTALELGQGETIANQHYTASHPLGGEGSTDFRCLDRFTARFDTNRWVFAGPSEVVYRHVVGRMRQAEAEIEVNVSSLTSGLLAVEASGDGKQWARVGEIANPGASALPLPSDLLPATEVWVRLRTGVGADLQVTSYTYRCRLPEADPALSLNGATRYLALAHQTGDLAVTVQSLGDLQPGRSNQVELAIANRGPRRLLAVSVRITRQGRTEWESDTSLSLAAEGLRRAELKYDLPASGGHQMIIRCLDSASAQPLWEGRLSFEVAPR